MKNWDPLRAHLRNQSFSEVAMTFAQIEDVLGFPLPDSAFRHRPWWSNNASNSGLTQAWLDAGFYSANVDMNARKLVFKRGVKVGDTSTKDMNSGMAEAGREFAAPASGKPPRRHPLFGSMKGTFWIDPNWDLTKPTMDEDELAEWDASLDRKADRIDAGLRRKP